MALRAGARRLGRRRRLRRRDRSGTPAAPAALGVPYDQAQWREVAHAVRRRAEAAGAGGAAARPRRGAAARRAGQLPRRARQALAGGAAAGDAEDRAVRQSTTASCWPRGRRQIVSVELGARASTSGCTAAASRPTTRPGKDRFDRFEELRRRWDEEHAKLKTLVLHAARTRPRTTRTWPRRYQAAQTRLRKFEEAGPPQEPPREQNITMRLRGGRTGMRAVTCAGLELTGLMQPFDLEIFYGDRVAVLGSNGSGKSHFLRLLAGRATVAHTGDVPKLGARVVPGLLRADPRAPRAGRPHPGRDPVGRARPGRGARRWRAAPLRAGAPGRAARSRRCPAASRRGSRSCCWSWPARRCCCSTSRPTTSTWRAPRPCRTGWRPSRARCSRSPTTAGSPGLRPVPGLRRRRRRVRGRRAGLGRGPGRAGAVGERDR